MNAGISKFDKFVCTAIFFDHHELHQFRYQTSVITRQRVCGTVQRQSFIDNSTINNKSCQFIVKFSPRRAAPLGKVPPPYLVSIFPQAL